jgi:hypothetical protein
LNSSLYNFRLGILLTTSGYLADWLKVKGHLTTTQIRKSFLCSSFLIQGVSLIIVGYLKDPLACVILITISIGIGALAISAFTVNPLDIASNYAGIIIGASNTIGMLSILTFYLFTSFIN